MRLLRQFDTLLAWVLLGWLGLRLGWSVASGVLPVVMWWSARRAGASARPRLHALLPWPPWLAVLLLAGLAGLPTGPWTLALLLLAAGLWGLSSATLSSPDPSDQEPLSHMTMGLMMGSLWLTSLWCLGPDWNDTEAVLLHLGLMAGTPLLLAILRRATDLNATLTQRQLAALVAVGALLLAGSDATTWRLAGMVLLVLAASLPHPAIESARSVPGQGWIGPALLLTVGLAAPTYGPVALQTAWLAVAVLAMAQWAPMPPSPLRRQHTPSPLE